MSVLDRLKAQRAADVKAVEHIPTLPLFIASQEDKLPNDTIYIIRRALEYHPYIARRVWETKVSWNRDFKRAAGMFSPRQSLIELHPGLLQTKDKRHLTETLLHELAHAMQYYAYNKCDHKETWREMMYLLGQKPERTHDIDECKDYEFVSRFDNLLKN